MDEPMTGPDLPALLLTIEETAKLLGRGVRQTRAAVHAGQLPFVVQGRSRYVPRAALLAYLETAGGWQPPVTALRRVRAQPRRSRRRSEPESKPTFAQRVLRAK